MKGSPAHYVDSINTPRIPMSWPGKGAVEFNHVSARYRTGLPLSLRDFSLSIPAGAKLGVCRLSPHACSLRTKTRMHLTRGAHAPYPRVHAHAHPCKFTPTTLARAHTLHTRQVVPMHTRTHAHSHCFSPQALWGGPVRARRALQRRCSGFWTTSPGPSASTACTHRNWAKGRCDPQSQPSPR